MRFSNYRATKCNSKGYFEERLIADIESRIKGWNCEGSLRIEPSDIGCDFFSPSILSRAKDAFQALPECANFSSFFSKGCIEFK